MNIDLSKKAWWDYVHHDLQELLQQSLILIAAVEKWGGKLPSKSHEFSDYSFIVFPAAKAYEGFLKTLFLDLGFISEKNFYGRRFRIGKALNPALKGRLRRVEGVYDRIVQYCGGAQLADSLWNTWKTCRNLLFHWFPNEKNAISFEEAKSRVEKVISTIDLAFTECEVSNSKN